MSQDVDTLQQENEQLRQEVAALQRKLLVNSGSGVRKRSERFVWGLPLYDIAFGPDSDANEMRGHARGIIAIGDLATGVVAIGGLARGVVAVGGLAIGAITIGGCSLGLLAAVGGLAVGGFALGGAAIGIYALGGAAFSL